MTLTFGLRHTLLQTPYETHGQQVAPTVDTHDWFLKRGQAAWVPADDGPIRLVAEHAAELFRVSTGL